MPAGAKKVPQQAGIDINKIRSQVLLSITTEIEAEFKELGIKKAKTLNIADRYEIDIEMKAISRVYERIAKLGHEN